MNYGPYSIVKTEPKPVMAPCKADGKVTSISDESKLAVCRCALNTEGCYVDEKNMVIQDKYRLISRV